MGVAGHPSPIGNFVHLLDAPLALRSQCAYAEDVPELAISAVGVVCAVRQKGSQFILLAACARPFLALCYRLSTEY
jgi:hypothetical protein